jgi:hypothetical protein
MSITTAQLNEMDGAALLAAYNEKAATDGKPTVKRFSDRPAALRRTAAILGIDPPDSVNPKKRALKKEPKAKKPKAAKTPKAAKAPREKKDGEAVRPGSNRDKLFKYMEKHLGQQLSITSLMKATYGEARKDYKGPLMMVMKGVAGVIKSQKLKLKIEKTRENKENYFGLHST